MLWRGLLLFLMSQMAMRLSVEQDRKVRSLRVTRPVTADLCFILYTGSDGLIRKFHLHYHSHDVAPD